MKKALVKIETLSQTKLFKTYTMAAEELGILDGDEGLEVAASAVEDFDIYGYEQTIAMRSAIIGEHADFVVCDMIAKANRRLVLMLEECDDEALEAALED